MLVAHSFRLFFLFVFSFVDRKKMCAVDFMLLWFRLASFSVDTFHLGQIYSSYVCVNVYFAGVWFSVCVCMCLFVLLDWFQICSIPNADNVCVSVRFVLFTFLANSVNSAFSYD